MSCDCDQEGTKSHNHNNHKCTELEIEKIIIVMLQSKYIACLQ